MNLRSLNLSRIVFLLLISVTTYFSIGAVRVYQTGKLKSDGSGNIKIIYSAHASELKAKQYIIGNFMFAEELAKRQFTSPNTSINKVKLDFNPADSLYLITVDVDFKDINKLSEANGFSNVKASYTKSDTGMVFRYIITANPNLYKDFENQSYVMEFANKVKSTNGALKDNTVTWGNRNSKNTDFSKDVALVATTTADGSVTTSNSPSGEKEKSCGLFGLELPIILLGGLVLNKSLKRKKI